MKKADDYFIQFIGSGSRRINEAVKILWKKNMLNLSELLQK